MKYFYESLNNFDIQKKMLEVSTQFLWELMVTHKDDIVNNTQEREAKLILQMMFSKLVHLEKLLEGCNFENYSGTSGINNFIDPTIINASIRNIFEMVCLFHLVYKLPNTDQEKTILYNLWVISGLKYRQKFISVSHLPESQAKAREEQLYIEKLISEIETCNLYQNMTEKNKKKIQTKIKSKDYKIKIVNSQVQFLSWQDIANEFILSAARDMFSVMYTYFSLYSHPSNVSVFQFKDIFKDEKQTIQMITLNLSFGVALSSIFLADLIEMFPAMLASFEKFSNHDQSIVNFYNIFLRGHDSSVNNSFEKL